MNATSFFVGFALGLFVCVVLLEHVVRPIHAQIVSAIAADRDRAVAELKAFRNLVVPQLGRNELYQKSLETKPPVPSTSDHAPEKTAAKASPAAPPLDPNKTPRPRGVPWRRWFNIRRRGMNSPQQRRDVLVAALQKQKVPTGEKDHE